MPNSSKIKKNRLFRVVVAFVVGVIVVLVMVSYGQELRRRVELQKHVSDLKKEITDHNQKIADLKNLLEYLKTDDYIERAAHEKLGFQNVGEHAVVIPNGGMVAGTQKVQDPQATAEKVSVSKQWWDLFFGYANQ